MGTPRRVATRATTSLPRLVPPAITTTDPAVSRAAITAVAVAAPENRSKSSPEAWWTLRTPYAASSVASVLGRGADHDGVDRHAAARLGQLAGERDRLEGDLLDALGSEVST